MAITYQSAVIMVQDIAASRAFYEGVLEQEVCMDFGANVSFAGGALALWQADRAHEIVFGAPAAPAASGEPAAQGEVELYFETDDLAAAVERLRQAGAPFVHPVRDQPWGQRVVRVRDPDGHIVEVGEPIPVFVARFLAQGMSVAEVAERTSVPADVVRQIDAQRA